MEPEQHDYVRHEVSDLTTTRLCRLDGCGNELDSADPSRGRHANICAPCRKGETLAGASWKQGQLSTQQGQLSTQRPAGQAGSGGIAGGGFPPRYPQAPQASTESSLEQKAKAIVPLARKLEGKVRASKAARKDAAAVVTEFSAALTELRDAAKALIGE